MSESSTRAATASLRSAGRMPDTWRPGSTWKSRTGETLSIFKVYREFGYANAWKYREDESGKHLDCTDVKVIPVIFDPSEPHRMTAALVNGYPFEIELQKAAASAEEAERQHAADLEHIQECLDDLGDAAPISVMVLVEQMRDRLRGEVAS